MTETESARRHWPLIAGIALPILFLVGFFVATAVARAFAEPPAYDLLYAVYESGESTVHLDFRVVDNRLKVHATRQGPALRGTPAPMAYASRRLYRFDASELESRVVDVDVPADFEGTIPLEVNALEGLQVSADPVAPDGYIFDQGRGRGGLLTGLFIGSRRPGAVVAKFGAVYPVDEHASPWAVEFLGWVIEDD